MAVSSMVGGAFLSATLQVLFDRLASREVLNLFSKRKSNAPGLLIKLKRKLLLLNGVLDDADVKQFTDKTVQAWSDDARDAVYQADDLLSEIAYEALRCQVEEESDPPGNLQSSTTSQVESLISGFFTSSSCFDDHVELKLEDIIRSVEGLMEDSDYLGLEKVVRPVFNTSSRSSTSVVVESDVYGRDSEKEKLINLLLSNGTKVGVVPVVGMGGMGKTTLAQLAYNDGRVGDSFEVKAWACVAEEFDIFKISKTILESVTESHCTSTDLNRIQESLKEELKAKKYLIVLDDVWNKSYREWDRLRAPFRTGAPGSKIIVTTRIQGAADIMTTGPVINLAELSDDKSWSLFAKIAFDEKDPSSFPLLEEIGRKIVARCKGLPLAVKSLAGLLRSKHQVEEWNDILRSEFWDLPEDTSDILPALRLSYHYLPSHLKQCFAFCSVFSKNYSFDRDDIVSMWIAQRFVLVQGGQSYGIEGRKCFHELLSMSFFQPHGSSKSRFVMHDLIHDLAQVVSGQFSFRLDDENPRDISVRARHFSICTRSVTGFQQLRGATEVNGLRSFLVTRIPEQVCLVEVLSRQKHLRLLSLRCYRRINEVLDIVGSLIHLHYLDLSRTAIEKLPEAICRLYNLETLLLVGCPNLTTLPTGIGRLCSLRRLDVTNTNLLEMPRQMSQLKGLKYLPTFVVGKRGGLCIDGLKAFSSLRGLLKILGLENVRDIKKGSEAMLREKQHLETLDLEWGTTSVNRSQNGRRLLNYLRPHTNLKQLKITRFGGKRFPDWLGHRWYAQMVSLILEECNNCLFLPPIGQLPSLKKLTVKGMAGLIEVGEEFYGSCAGTYQPFPSLESLKFEDMYNWVKWYIPGVGEFPKLRQLKMIDCTKIVGGIPDINFHSMVIRRCFRLEVLVPTVSSSNVVTDAGKELVVHGSKGVDLNWQFMCGLVKLYLSDLPSLQVLTTELYTLTILKDLEIRECPNLVSLSNMSLPPMLSGLVISLCDSLQSVVDGPVLFCTLQRLTIRHCPSLVRFAVNGLPSSLSKVEFWNCPQLEFPLPEYTESCYSVDELGLRACPSLKPTILQKLFPNLQRLKIFSDDSVTSFLNGQRACNDQQGLLENLTSITMRDCTSLKSIPEGLFDSLPSLGLQNCPEMESFGEAGLPSSLVELNIIRCEKLVSFRSGWGLQRLPCLRNLKISGADEFVESFPEEGLLPSTLTKLELVSFPNWKALNWKGFQHLISLRDLTIWKCPQLQSFPEEELPPFIITLRIGECPLLTPRCQKDVGADWPKIAHIPNIILDYDLISS